MENEYVKELVRKYLEKNDELLRELQHRMLLDDDPTLKAWADSISEVVTDLGKVDYELNREDYLRMLGLDGGISLINRG